MARIGCERAVEYAMFRVLDRSDVPSTRNIAYSRLGRAVQEVQCARDGYNMLEMNRLQAERVPHEA